MKQRSNNTRVQNHAGLTALLATVLVLATSCTGLLDPANRQSAVMGLMIHVPAGTFQRDSNPANLCQVKEFWMSQTEVTWARYEALMGLEGLLARDYSDGSDQGPATFVSWYMAISFCNKASLAEGLEPVYRVVGVDFSDLSYLEIPWQGSDQVWDYLQTDLSANGYRLPTESEWMWAAMGADSKAPGQVNTSAWAKAFAGAGDHTAIEDYAVFGWGSSEAGGTITERSNPVGSRLGNELGLLDMSGNAAEWCQDWYQMNLPEGKLDADYAGPSDPQDATFHCRCIRGGSWYLGSDYASVANRASFQSPWYQGYTIGFRVVRR